MKNLLSLAFCILLPGISLDSYCEYCENQCEYCEEDKNFCLLKTLEHIDSYKKEMKEEGMSILEISEVNALNKQIFLSGCIYSLECIQMENTLRESRK